MIFIDLSHRRHRFSHPNFRRRKVCLDFGLKSSWACLCRGVYQKVDQRCAWVVTVSNSIEVDSIEVEAHEAATWEWLGTIKSDSVRATSVGVWSTLTQQDGPTQ